MSNLITAQNEEKTRKNNKKQDSKNQKTDSCEDSSSSSEYKKRAHRKAQGNEHLTRQAAIVIAIRYTKKSL